MPLAPRRTLLMRCLGLPWGLSMPSAESAAGESAARAPSCALPNSTAAVCRGVAGEALGPMLACGCGRGAGEPSAPAPPPPPPLLGSAWPLREADRRESSEGAGGKAAARVREGWRLPHGVMLLALAS